MSVENTIRRSSHMPFALKTAVRLPTMVSAKLTIEAYCCRSCVGLSVGAMKAKRSMYSCDEEKNRRLCPEDGEPGATLASTGRLRHLQRRVHDVRRPEEEERRRRVVRLYLETAPGRDG